MKLKLLLVAAILGFTALFVLLPKKTDVIQSGALPGGVTAHLFDPSSNNAVAAAEVGGVPFLYSFSGLGEGASAGAIHSHAFAVNVTEQWAKELPDVPGGVGRLASTAATVANTIYVIGGYTVAEDGGEVSTPEVYAFNPATETYSARAPMPVPVDDTVSFVYRDRYIYLVSGWHNDGNVAAVQVYDAAEDRWFTATPYPGAPVFGHAGGISGNRFVIADGVRVVTGDDGARGYAASDEAWLGTIDANDPAVIDWQPIPAHPGRPLYRMAAAGVEGENLVVFAGGSDNPYNYDGIGYDGAASAPSATVFGFDIVQKQWHVYGEKPYPTMDHRGLLQVGKRFYILGGMIQNQDVTDAVSWFSLENEND